MTSENHIDALLRTARDCPSPLPSTELTSRVLADAATLMHAATPPPKPRFWARLLSPIGGARGAVALACCASLGVFAGAGYADELLALPGLESVLAGLVDPTDGTTPFESLSLLMSEG